MYPGKRFFECVILFSLIAMFGGGATEAASKSDEASFPKVYSPKLPSDINTLEEAKKDLAILLKDVDVIFYDAGYCPKFPGERAAKALFEKYPRMRMTNVMYTATTWSIYKDKGGIIDVYDDRIDFPLFPLFYYQLSDDIDISVIDGYLIKLSHHVELRASEGVTQKIADDLFFIQQNFKKPLVALFELKAAEYRALKVKPPVSEEQRKYIVQANAFTQQKDYSGAIARYNKAVALNQVSYPAAYSNMALLYAQERRFKLAIEHMKKYLLLEPEAKDARSAQDKIYEWEAMLDK
ncbi:MAG: tetratricopeptide repeat protein [Desulfurivibrionaceae bacterium]